jgi:hypothetical protein
MRVVLIFHINLLELRHHHNHFVLKFSAWTFNEYCPLSLNNNIFYHCKLYNNEVLICSSMCPFLCLSLSSFCLSVYLSVYQSLHMAIPCLSVRQLIWYLLNEQSKQACALVPKGRALGRGELLIGASLQVRAHLFTTVMLNKVVKPVDHT